jgi:hypothetical protein
MVIGAATPIVIVHGVSERAACDCDVAASGA